MGNNAGDSNETTSGDTFLSVPVDIFENAMLRTSGKSVSLVVLSNDVNIVKACDV